MARRPAVHLVQDGDSYNTPCGTRRVYIKPPDRSHRKQMAWCEYYVPVERLTCSLDEGTCKMCRAEFARHVEAQRRWRPTQPVEVMSGGCCEVCAVREGMPSPLVVKRYPPLTLPVR